jgi:hypothetical protein
VSAFIGSVKGRNSQNDVIRVWCSVGGVEVASVLGGPPDDCAEVILVSIDPISARTLAALLVQASEEVERMRESAR